MITFTPATDLLYHVYVDGVDVLQKPSEGGAMAAAVQYVDQNPGAVVRIVHDYDLTVTNPAQNTGILFSEDFSTQPDWSIASGTVPPNWTFKYSDGSDSLSIGPSTYSTGRVLRADYANDSSQYVADGWLGVDVTPSAALRVTFRLRFEDNFNPNNIGGSIKLFRILSYDGTGNRATFFEGGNSAPIYLFDWAHSREGNTQYGVRHKHAYRADPQATQYKMADSDVGDNIQSIVNGDQSANFTDHIAPLGAVLPDLANGGNLPTSGTVFHNQVFGNQWHDMEFFVELNSAPDVQDGKLHVFMDGQPLILSNQIAWIQAGGSMEAKWNHVAFGGNGKAALGAPKFVEFADIVVS